MPFLHLIKVNVLHLPTLGLPSGKNGSGTEVGMEHIPKPIINAYVLRHLIKIDLSCLFSPLPTL
jgi:hypothetical protein